MRTRVSGWAAICAVAASAGCAGDKATAPSVRSPDATLGSIAVSAQNAIIAVGGTHQINVTGRSLAGNSITEFDSIRYVLPSATDTIRVIVSSAGLVTGRASSVATPVLLNVFAYKDGVGKGDQVVIQVTSAALADPTLSIQRVPPDSARIEHGRSKAIVPVVRESGGATVANTRFRLTVKGDDAKRMAGYMPDLRLPGADGVPVTNSIGVGLNQVFTQLGEGTAWVHAEVDAYGMLLRDSVKFTLQYRSTEAISLATSGGLSIAVLFSKEAIWVAPGARVTFSGGVGLAGGIRPPVTYVFDNPTAATAANPPSTLGGASGNVVSVSGSQRSVRVFATPGTFRWTATVEGNYPPLSGQSISGIINVK